VCEIALRVPLILKNLKKQITANALYAKNALTYALKTLCCFQQIIKKITSAHNAYLPDAGRCFCPALPGLELQLLPLQGLLWLPVINQQKELSGPSALSARQERCPSPSFFQPASAAATAWPHAPPIPFSLYGLTQVCLVFFHLQSFQGKISAIRHALPVETLVPQEQSVS
jgi:hypothetical protein